MPHIQEQQLTQAYNEHAPGLLRYCSFKVSDLERANELLQDTFTKAWDFMKKSRTVVHNIRAFLYHIMGNLIIDEYRRRRQTESLETMQEAGFEPSIDTTEQLIDRLDGKRLTATIQKLPTRYADIIRMRIIQDLSLSEIARKTRQTENAIAVQIHRAVAKLRQICADEISTFLG